MIARAYLDARGHAYQVFWDVAEHDNGDPFGYVILTDYASDVWRRPLRGRDAVAPDGGHDPSPTD